MINRNSGFTLIELILVVAVIGIVSAVVISNVRGQLIGNDLRQANSQVIADLERMRSASLMTSRNSTMTIASDNHSYVLALNGDEGNQMVTLPGNVNLVVTNSIGGSVVTGPITYSAPYGTVGAPGTVFTLSVPGSTQSLQFYLLGVTGKVVQR